MPIYYFHFYIFIFSNLKLSIRIKINVNWRMNKTNFKIISSLRTQCLMLIISRCLTITKAYSKILNEKEIFI